MNCFRPLRRDQCLPASSERTVLFDPDFAIRASGRVNVYVPSVVLNCGDQTGEISGAIPCEVISGRDVKKKTLRPAVILNSMELSFRNLVLPECFGRIKILIRDSSAAPFALTIEVQDVHVPDWRQYASPRGRRPELTE
jgi:hypothetical protein